MVSHNFHGFSTLNILLFFLWPISTSIEGKKNCADGENLILIKSLRKDDPISFSDLKILTYDAAGKPFCQQGKGSLHFPGFIRIVSGEIKIQKNIDSPKDRFRLQLTLEQNSFFIGSVCAKGKSANSFVTDDLCSYDLCKLLPKKCELLSVPGSHNLADLFTGLIPLEPAPFAEIEGEWKGGLSLVDSKTGKLLAKVDLKPWHHVKVGGEEAEKTFKKARSEVGSHQEL